MSYSQQHIDTLSRLVIMMACFNASCDTPWTCTRCASMNGGICIISRMTNMLISLSITDPEEDAS